MNDNTLDRLVTSTATVDDARLASLDLTDGHDALLAEIMATRSAAPVVRRPHRSLLVAAAVVAVALAIGVPTWLTRGGPAPVAAPATTIAPKAAPAPIPSLQFLIDEPGWTVQYVDISSGAEGDISFVHGSRSLEVNRYAANEYDGYYDDRMHVSAATPATTLGQTGAMFTYGADDHAVILPVRDGTFLELRGQGLPLPAFLDLLSRLTPVPEQQWEDAMPASVVLPSEEDDVAREMLVDVPTPPGFDRSKLRSGGTHGYYSFGTRVTGAVVCGWIDAYRAASDAGDQAAMQTASDALGTSRSWTVLNKMTEGDWPNAIRQTSDEIKAGNLRPQTDYRAQLGCHG